VTELRRARLTVAYHGAGFHGFADNPGVRTVMGELAAAVATIVRQPVELTGAGRTDAGVHAWGQVVSGDLPEAIDLGDLMRRVNKLCAPGIAVRSADWAEPGFDARFSATWRQYRYLVWNDPSPNPLLAGTVWHVPKPLDLDTMALGAAALVGEHDFSSFCRRPSVAGDQPEPSMVRIVYEVGWSRVDEMLLRFEVRGSAFCHQQVRSMVGTLVDVGLGRIAADRVADIIAARDRNAAGQVAPPEGLVLWAVGYDGTRWDSL
jgi:tRNA pseudouridine38-40 synthase